MAKTKGSRSAKRGKDKKKDKRKTPASVSKAVQKFNQAIAVHSKCWTVCVSAGLLQEIVFADDTKPHERYKAHAEAYRVYQRQHPEMTWDLTDPKSPVILTYPSETPRTPAPLAPKHKCADARSVLQGLSVTEVGAFLEGVGLTTDQASLFAAEDIDGRALSHLTLDVLAAPPFAFSAGSRLRLWGALQDPAPYLPHETPAAIEAPKNSSVDTTEKETGSGQPPAPPATPPPREPAPPPPVLTTTPHPSPRTTPRRSLSLEMITFGLELNGQPVRAEVSPTIPMSELETTVLQAHPSAKILHRKIHRVGQAGQEVSLQNYRMMKVSTFERSYELALWTIPPPKLVCAPCILKGPRAVQMCNGVPCVGCPPGTCALPEPTAPARASSPFVPAAGTVTLQSVFSQKKGDEPPCATGATAPPPVTSPLHVSLRPPGQYDPEQLSFIMGFETQLRNKRKRGDAALTRVTETDYLTLLHESDQTPYHIKVPATAIGVPARTAYQLLKQKGESILPVSRIKELLHEHHLHRKKGPKRLKALSAQQEECALLWKRVKELEAQDGKYELPVSVGYPLFPLVAASADAAGKPECVECGSHESEKNDLLCDGCDEPYHLRCVGLEVPPPEDEQWFCLKCSH